MSRERLYLFDTTLRDGAQTAGIEFSLEDKIAIIGLLEDLGVDYIEGGYPGANPVDTSFFERRRTKKAVFTAFGMTKRAGRSAANDPGVMGLTQSAADATCFVAKAWDYQVELALGSTTDEHLEGIADTVRTAITAGKEALIDLEHFFDGYKANPSYALACVQTALDAGARWVVLCDTNGGTMPSEIREIVGAVLKIAPGDRLGIHPHDDTGQAVANALAAVEAGVRQVQGTLNGLGERCGNTNLVTLIPTLVLKPYYAERFETGITPAQLERLTHISRAFDDRLNRAPARQAPYVGASAFATKAGIHASALLKDFSTYEHVPPESVGNERSIMVSQQAGKSNLLTALARHHITLEKDDPRLEKLLATVKEREARGYSYDGADASFAVLARRVLGTLPNFFDVENYRAMVERRHNAQGEEITVTEAVVKIRVAGELLMSVAEGNGPVNALDLALRKDLGIYSRRIEDLELVDFKVRILDGGTGAVTRVLVESRDGSGERWVTIGVSPNIIDASFEALYESITYKLLKTDAAQDSAD
ncbi:citramalate synthase [Devosia sp. 63-57]|uniref:citramalate synthase n=1 Tax=Devosia sp. 63-57 TaxID=1895751 RepID=UPI00086D279C|nr:citramalate synthase [Devosia sp. 63-57]ODT47328.1 MAG: citramalate synthase [Pelagibacterium sp. SCN 63-126]ODU87005.1 MAG: citramalate synthase [Pelagibacterium sp. SCN 63-17]OJX42964.1 MAG: citramalate synthase [Devosia sp. 63-57]